MLVRGTASNILLDLLMMVKRYRNPSLETGSGPTMSTWMWENRCWGTGIGCTAGWLVTLALVQDWQSFTHSVTSLFMQDHTTLSVMILLVALVPGCATPWKASNTWRWWPKGIIGRGEWPLV